MNDFPINQPKSAELQLTSHHKPLNGNPECGVAPMQTEQSNSSSSSTPVLLPTLRLIALGHPVNPIATDQTVIGHLSATRRKASQRLSLLALWSSL
jgi:hypothetical protein